MTGGQPTVPQLRLSSFPPACAKRPRRGEGPSPRTGLTGLSVAALGIVFGHIGTMLIEWTQELLSEEIIENVLAGLRDIAANAEKDIHS